MVTSKRNAVIILGGEMNTAPDIDSVDLIVAADSGYDHALNLSIEVDLLVGDLDSISAEGLEHARRSGVEIEEHPLMKDHTDLELAVMSSIERGATTIDLYGGEGGRLGHLLGVALLSSNTELGSREITWHTEGGRLRTATPSHPVTLSPPLESTVSLLPLCDVHGATTSGLHWELNDETLEQGSSRGVSNITTAENVRVEIESGVLLVIDEGVV